MREILFKGKRKDNGEWVYGYVYRIWERVYILWGMTNDVPNMIEVDPETVGQYTGLTDKNGKKIFEGDILEGLDYDEDNGYSVVTWDDGAFEVGNIHWCGTFHENYSGGDFEIIGNIHDNPELLQMEV